MRLRTLGDADLHGGVVLGLDDAVGGRALAWDVQVDEFSACGVRVSSYYTQSRIVSGNVRSFSILN